MRILVPILLIALVGAIVLGTVRARRRSRVPELNRHPERLEQMLDETDDA